jgi:hypothetical protein
MFHHQKLKQLFEYLLLLNLLAVFKLGFEVQLEPSYSSVAPVTGGILPPNAKPAVCYLHLLNHFLLYLKD